MRPEGAYRVTGSRGTALAVWEHGDAAGPGILFIHGFCQSHLSWAAQLAGPALAPFRMVSFDLRGHGDSEKPRAPADYDDDRVWAGDLDAVIAGAGLERPVLVAWSLGGRVVQDYLHRFGAASVAAVNFVGAALRVAGTGPCVSGPALSGDLAAEDAGLRRQATQAFLRSCFAVPPPDEAFAAALADNMKVPAAVRRLIMARAPAALDAGMLADLPVLITHGAADRVMPAAGARAAADRLPHARLSLYDGIGHAVMAEAPDRFNGELAAFVAAASRGARR